MELDVGPTGGEALLNIYRVGYTPTDSAATPFKTFHIKADAINDANRHTAHDIDIEAVMGVLTVRLDGQSEFIVAEAPAPDPALPFGAPPAPLGQIAKVVLNPMGGRDVVTYGYLGDIGFQADAGQAATFSRLEIRNVRAPGQPSIQ